MSKCDECNLGCVDFGNCFQCKGNTCEKEVRADERANVLEEVKNSIHTIYSQDLHCKADMCEMDTMGYECVDCLATFLMGYIEDVMKSHK